MIELQKPNDYDLKKKKKKVKNSNITNCHLEMLLKTGPKFGMKFCSLFMHDVLHEWNSIGQKSLQHYTHFVTNDDFYDFCLILSTSVYKYNILDQFIYIFLMFWNP